MHSRWTVDFVNLPNLFCLINLWPVNNNNFVWQSNIIYCIFWVFTWTCYKNESVFDMLDDLNFNWSICLHLSVCERHSINSFNKVTTKTICPCFLPGLQMGGGEAAVLTKESRAFRQGSIYFWFYFCQYLNCSSQFVYGSLSSVWAPVMGRCVLSC